MSSHQSQAGFSLLELTLVICIIALLATVWLRYANDAVDDAERAALSSISRSFASSMGTLRAKWQLGKNQGKKGQSVQLDHLTIFVNQEGWPTNTTGPLAKGAAQTPQGCLQLWQAVLQNPVKATLEGQQPRGTERFHISTPSYHRCRYELSSGTAGSHYFDYHINTGQVELEST